MPISLSKRALVEMGDRDVVITVGPCKAGMIMIFSNRDMAEDTDNLECNMDDNHVVILFKNKTSLEKLIKSAKSLYKKWDDVDKVV